MGQLAEPKTRAACHWPTLSFHASVFLGLAGCLFTGSPPLAPPQVTFRPDLSTAEVHDEHIKGPLKVGLRRHGGAERGCAGGWRQPVLCSMLDEQPVFAPQVGAVVEVKNPDGVYQEATINKLTDASIYTVGESATSPFGSVYRLGNRGTVDFLTSRL